MPSASVAETAIVTDLKCFGCGNPIIKDGQFKCLRCRPKRNVPATLDKRDIVCPRHRQTVVLMRYDRASGQYRAHCQKSGCPSHDGKTGTLIPQTEEIMTQGTVEQKENPPASVSKTKELRDWLDGEIKRHNADINVLEGALRDAKASFVGSHFTPARYAGLTSDEREAKVGKDERVNLPLLKRNLESLKSARKLDVDIDALEKAGFEISVDMNPQRMQIKAFYRNQIFIETKNCTLFIYPTLGRMVGSVQNGLDKFHFQINDISKLAIETSIQYQRKAWILSVHRAKSYEILTAMIVKFVAETPTSVEEVWEVNSL